MAEWDNNVLTLVLQCFKDYKETVNNARSAALQCIKDWKEKQPLRYKFTMKLLIFWEFPMTLYEYSGVCKHIADNLNRESGLIMIYTMEQEFKRREPEKTGEIVAITDHWLAKTYKKT